MLDPVVVAVPEQFTLVAVPLQLASAFVVFCE
jgi:hypothetical protein